jgi:hypothetical protein
MLCKLLAVHGFNLARIATIDDWAAKLESVGQFS